MSLQVLVGGVWVQRWRRVTLEVETRVQMGEVEKQVVQREVQR